MSAPLPAFVTRLIRLIVPARASQTVLDDLADDYAKAREHGRPHWWLLRETASLVTAFGLARLQRVKATGPIWTRDFTLVIRSLRRGPVAALGAAATLSAGLVAVMLTAGLANTLLFRHVSATHGDALQRIAVVDRLGRTALRLSYVELQLIRDHLDDVGLIGSVILQPVVIRIERESVHTMAEVVDGPYVTLTGTETLIGRGLLSIDHHAGAAPTAVISEPLWRRRFAASPGVLGEIIHLNGQPFSVVGVARALGSASFLGASVDAWVSTTHADPLLNRGWRTNVDERSFTAFLLPTAAPAEVDARLHTATATLVKMHGEMWRERRLHLTDATVLVGSQRATVVVLAGILGALSLLMLATAASNLGGLLLARAAATRRHVAIHLAIGSGRMAVVRRQLLEGVLIGTVGAAIAIATYAVLARQLAEIALLPTLALRLELPLDSRAVATVIMAGASAGLFLALGPALWATRLQLADAMRDAEPRVGGGRGLSRMRRLLVSAQVSLTLVLIVAAALFTKSLEAMLQSDLGFDGAHLVAMDFDVEPTSVSTSELASLAREALRRVEETPGVLAAAMSNRAPVDSSTPVIEARAIQNGTALGDVTMYLATARYFETVGVPIVAGRAFTEAETEGKADVAIVNEALARQFWPGSDALDQRLHFADEAAPMRVVGVAGNSKYRSIGETLRPHVYRPTPATLRLTLLARALGDPGQVLPTLQATLDTVGPGLVGFFPRTLDDHLAIQFLPTRAAAGAATVLGVLALGLSALGLYGLASWFVELRRREIGVRMALGASTHDVRRMIVRQAVGTALPGIVAGVLLAAALALMARAAFFGVGPLDPSALALAIVVLMAVVIVAAYEPSRRATRVEPAITLRS